MWSEVVVSLVRLVVMESEQKGSDCSAPQLQRSAVLVMRYDGQVTPEQRAAGGVRHVRAV